MKAKHVHHIFFLLSPSPSRNFPGSTTPQEFGAGGNKGNLNKFSLGFYRDSPTSFKLANNSMVNRTIVNQERGAVGFQLFI